MIATQPLSPAEARPPKQTKLLGAVVQGVGTITTVSTVLFDCYALIEDEAGNEHHCFIKDLRRDQLTFPSEAQPYREVTRRIGYGLWDSVYSLLSPVEMEARMAA
jgi:hypothetical protein